MNAGAGAGRRVRRLAEDIARHVTGHPRDAGAGARRVALLAGDSDGLPVRRPGQRSQVLRAFFVDFPRHSS